jgi:hypothetical protein
MTLAEMGGQFWPLEEEEEDMPEVGAKFPMMLYDGERECIVYDEKERLEAKQNGFSEHPSMETAKPPGIVKPPDKPSGGPDAPSQGLPSKGMPPPIPKAPPEVKTTVTVQKTVEVKPKTPTSTPSASPKPKV